MIYKKKSVFFMEINIHLNAAGGKKRALSSPTSLNVSYYRNIPFKQKDVFQN